MTAPPRVLVAHEPANYREALAAVLPELRPGLRVRLVEPDDLDAAAARLRPAVVVCSRLSAAVRAHAAAWVLLYPDGEDRAAVGGIPEPYRLEHPLLADVLAMIDAAVAGGAPPAARPARPRTAPAIRRRLGNGRFRDDAVVGRR
jgi:hypothetical protein